MTATTHPVVNGDTPLTEDEFHQIVDHLFGDPKQATDFGWIVVEIPLQQLVLEHVTEVPTDIVRRRLGWSIERLRQSGLYDMQKIDGYVATLRGQGRW